ncbi:transposable element Tcb2 transposase [Trichonephila clavipes]|uniref:Transposable element Tcb2 transposase n=1 Tax=Trichonephila clavipes TaxID=2585209 RepID=A0A8X6RM60_TRICX|nr:transposable element Tcb2 transposase [Trichonephila clavipes]
MDPTCQQRTVQAGGGSMMVWSVFSWRDMGPLIRLDTTLTGDRIATYWLQEHSAEFGRFRWPLKSPDINIIEHISDVLQRAIQKRYPPPTDFWTAL